MPLHINRDGKLVAVSADELLNEKQGTNSCPDEAGTILLFPP
ncbi:MAG: hypothetical protein ACHQM6_02525 [Candidatus Kapaibacterium sp.]